MEDAIKTSKRKVLVGQVVATRPKTIVVRVKRPYRIPKYGKIKIRYKKCHAHDENNTASVGDIVSIQSSRARSALKRWVLLPPEAKKKKKSS